MTEKERELCEFALKMGAAIEQFIIYKITEHYTDEKLRWDALYTVLVNTCANMITDSVKPEYKEESIKKFTKMMLDWLEPNHPKKVELYICPDTNEISGVH